jgi:hypothetical protein
MSLLTASPPDKVVEDLKLIIPVLYEGMEAGATAARDYFGGLDAEIEPFLFATLTRYHANRRLNQLSPAVPFARAELSNNGIFLVYNMYHLRILKMDDGQVPSAGHSQSKHSFYSQIWQPPLPYAELDEPAPHDHLNLVVLWDVSKRGNLKDLVLVCPKRSGIGRCGVSIHWSIAIGHPATTPQDERGPEPPSTLAHDTDLPYGLADDIADEMDRAEDESQQSLDGHV